MGVRRESVTHYAWRCDSVSSDIGGTHRRSVSSSAAIAAGRSLRSALDLRCRDTRCLLRRPGAHIFAQYRCIGASLPGIVCPRILYAANGHPCLRSAPTGSRAIGPSLARSPRHPDPTGLPNATRGIERDGRSPPGIMLRRAYPAEGATRLVMQPRYRLLFIDIDGTLSGGPSEISQAKP